MTILILKIVVFNIENCQFILRLQ